MNANQFTCAIAVLLANSVTFAGDRRVPVANPTVSTVYSISSMHSQGGYASLAGDIKLVIGANVID